MFLCVCMSPHVWLSFLELKHVFWITNIVIRPLAAHLAPPPPPPTHTPAAALLFPIGLNRIFLVINILFCSSTAVQFDSPHSKYFQIIATEGSHFSHFIAKHLRAGRSFRNWSNPLILQWRKLRPRNMWFAQVSLVKRNGPRGFSMSQRSLAYITATFALSISFVKWQKWGPDFNPGEFEEVAYYFWTFLWWSEKMRVALPNIWKFCDGSSGILCGPKDQGEQRGAHRLTCVFCYSQASECLPVILYLKYGQISSSEQTILNLFLSD